MIKNYIKIAFRTILKNPFYSIVNMLGLATGIAFTFIIAGCVWSELQVNRNLSNYKNQYIILSKWKNPDMGFELATEAPLAKTLKENYPTLVKNYYRFDGVTSNVSKGDKMFRESLQIGDSTLLSMFGFQLLYGNPAAAFSDPFSVVITEDKAIKYFNKTDVVGQTITIESFSGSKHDFTISGVMKTPERNSVTKLTADNDNQFYLPEASTAFFGRDMTTWQNFYIVNFIELQDGVSPKALEKPIAQLMKMNAPPMVPENMKPTLESLKDYYLNASNGLVKRMLYTLSFIAFFILLMAIINFVNISVSRSSSRMREIGIRKVMGGMRKSLILQFLIESIVLVGASTIISLFMYQLSKNYFATLLNRPVLSLFDFPVVFILIPLAIIFVIGLLSGIYPALVLSSLKSVESLKGKLQTKENIWLRKSLVAFQFCIASIVFIAALVVSQQINFFFSKSIGFDKDYIVTAQLPRDWTEKGVNHMEATRDEFSRMPQVANVALSYEIPNGANIGAAAVFKTSTDSTQSIASQLLVTDDHYTSTYNIAMSAGDFYKHPGGAYDSSKVVINETAAKALGYKSAQDAVGQQLSVVGIPAIFNVAGVTKDFHAGSMQKAISPSIFMNVNFIQRYRYLSFKLKPGNVASSIEALQKKWSQLLPGSAFEYSFMDDELKKVYTTELQLKRAAYAASVLALIIVLLGIIGLTSLSIQKRTKEIGIRKILGAPVFNIIGLFMKDFLPVLFIGSIIACPLAFIVLRRWLNDYAYRIDLTSHPFIFAIVILGFITIAVIVIQTIKAAVANPVKNLRTE